MTPKLIDVLKSADDLSSEEQMQVIMHLAQRNRQRAVASDGPTLQWAELRGRAQGPITGEDAQAWVTRSRNEDRQMQDPR